MGVRAHSGLQGRVLTPYKPCCGCAGCVWGHTGTKQLQQPRLGTYQHAWRGHHPNTCLCSSSSASIQAGSARVRPAPQGALASVRRQRRLGSWAGVTCWLQCRAAAAPPHGRSPLRAGGSCSVLHRQGDTCRYVAVLSFLPCVPSLHPSLPQLRCHGCGAALPTGPFCCSLGPGQTGSAVPIRLPTAGPHGLGVEKAVSAEWQCV